MNQEKNTIIDLDNIFNIAKTGIYKATIFMGYGVNCARNEMVNEFNLSDTFIRMLPEKIESSTLQNWKSSFEIWVINNALRESIEFFSICLDHLYQYITIVKREPHNIKFQRFGLNKKLSILDKYGIATEFSEHIQSIYAYRNAIAHRGGIVGEDDLTAESSFILKWYTPRTFLRTLNNDEIEFPNPSDLKKNPFIVDKGNHLISKFIEQTLSFKKGYSLEISAEQIQEIIFFLSIVVEKLKKRTLEFSQENGVKIFIKNTPSA